MMGLFYYIEKVFLSIKRFFCPPKKKTDRYIY